MARKLSVLHFSLVIPSFFFSLSPLPQYFQMNMDFFSLNQNPRKYDINPKLLSNVIIPKHPYLFEP